MANVAQLVEPRFVVPVVVGSSPIVRPRLYSAIVQSFFMRTFGLSGSRPSCSVELALELANFSSGKYL